jgi:hypothetical protein
VRAAPLTRLIGSVAFAGALLVSLLAPATASTSTSSGVAQLRSMLNSLTVQSERNSGYSRGRFDDWTSKNGCDTREWVMIAEAQGGTRSGCDVAGARWWSYLDGTTTRNASTFDIDHTVALAEAWGSGAWKWTRAQRDAYANDLGYRDSLIAVSASSNRSKGERDPAEWMPPRNAADCRLVEAWIAVKWRWRLSVDAREKSALTRELSRCTKRVVPLPSRVR